MRRFDARALLASVCAGSALATGCVTDRLDATFWLRDA